MESIRELEQMLEEARRIQDDRLIANLAYKLGDRRLEKGKLDLAQPLLEEALALCRKHENRDGEAVVALSLATLHLRAKAPEEAAEAARTAYACSRSPEDPKRLVRACMARGDAAWEQGQPARALPFYQEGLGICRSHEDTLGTATFLDRIATMHRLQDADAPAREAFAEALELWRNLDVPDRQAVTLVHLGHILSREGQREQAIGCLEEARKLFGRAHNQPAASAVEREVARLRSEP